MSMPGQDLFFYQQKGTQRPSKRFRKLAEELPQSLRFAHLSPKVAAFLANKEKVQHQKEADELDGLSKTSLLSEITQSFHNVRGRIDSMLENDEDSQRYLYDEARLSAPSVLYQLARFLYTYDEIYTCIPGSLEYLLMMGWKEMTVDVIPVPREWQTVAMRETLAAGQSSEELVGVTSLEEQSSGNNVDSGKSKTDKTLVEPAKLKKRPSKDEEDEINARVISSSKKGDRSITQVRPAKGFRNNRLKSVGGESRSGSVIGRSPGSISTIGEYSPDFRHFHTTFSASIVQFQLSSSMCEEKGWIVPHHSQVEVCEDDGNALETALKILQAAVKKTKEQVLQVDVGFNQPIKVKYYGDGDAQTIKSAKNPNQHINNPIYRGEKPRLPDVSRDMGRSVMKSITNDGTTTVIYPSGRLAVVSSQSGFGHPGYYTLAYDDELDSKLVACFTPSGRGICLHSNGVVRFLVNKRGGHLANTDGTITRKWRWPMGGMKLTTPISVQVSSFLTLRCHSRSNIVLIFSCQKLSAKFVVGPVPGFVEAKRSDEEQLLTSFSFSSKSASDVNRIVAPKKSTSKTKKKKDKSKAYIAEVQKLLDDHGPDELDAERDLIRLQHKTRILVDDWMEHYRINIGLSAASLKTMKDEPSIRKRDIQSAKTPPSSSTPLASKTEVEIEAPDPAVKLRAPSAPVFSEVRERLLHRAQTAASSRPTTAALKEKEEKVATNPDEVHSAGHTQRAPLHSAPGTRPRPHSMGAAKSTRSAVIHTALAATHTDGMTPSSAPQTGFCPVSLRAAILGYERPTCHCSRHHIPFITDIEYQTFLKNEVSLNQMVIISVVSSLYPDSTPGEIMIEKIHANQNKNRTRPCVAARHDPFRILRYDIASAAYESDHTQPVLLARHNVVPGMFLIYQNGSLIFCDHIFNGYGNAKKDFRKQIMKCRADAIHGRFLPRDFHFSPGRGRIGRRAAWGGQMGGAGVDHYGNPGIYISPETPITLRPESASTSNTELQLQLVSNQTNFNLKGLQPRIVLQSASFVRNGPSRGDVTIRSQLSSKSCVL